MLPAIIVLVLFTAFFGAALWAFRFAFYSPAKRRENLYNFPKDDQYSPLLEKMTGLIKDMEALPFEEVRITSFDGTELFGRYLHVADGAPLQIQFHGYRGAALRDFCGGNRLARKMGQNTLLVDQRAHGKSGGNVITFGIRERLDCLCWARYARERFGPETKIILAGVSMGAATVLMASELDLPENVVGIIADCPYSSPAGIIRKVCGDMGFPKAPALLLVRLAARLFGGFSLLESSAEAAVRNTDIPVLLFHGEDDRFVPFEMSEKIAAENKSKIRLETFPGAGHGLSYMVDPKRYENITAEFIESCLKKSPSGSH